ncbi:MAG: comM protein [Phenylobacterium sp.]|nr:comM protein [Phenylobacterium sp.]
MAARVVTVAFQGVEARRVEVEVQFTSGEPKFILVGLGATRRSPKAVNGCGRPSRASVWRCRPVGSSPTSPRPTCRRKPAPPESTAEAASRVGRARALQVARAASDASGAAALNAQADGDFLDRIADLDAPARALLSRAAETGGLTACGWTRTLRLARTVADLEGSDSVRRVHIAEVLIYRRVSPAAAGAPLMAG